VLDLSTGGDGRTRVLWEYEGGANGLMSLYVLDQNLGPMYQQATRAYLSSRPVALSTGADNRTRLLWAR
jgi:hypothetical protein